MQRCERCRHRHHHAHPSEPILEIASAKLFLAIRHAAGFERFARRLQTECGRRRFRGSVGWQRCSVANVACIDTTMPTVVNPSSRSHPPDFVLPLVMQPGSNACATTSNRTRATTLPRKRELAHRSCCVANVCGIDTGTTHPCQPFLWNGTRMALSSHLSRGGSKSCAATSSPNACTTTSSPNAARRLRTERWRRRFRGRSFTARSTATERACPRTVVFHPCSTRVTGSGGLPRTPSRFDRSVLHTITANFNALPCSYCII